MSIKSISNLHVQCSIGWGWTRRYSETTDLLPVDQFPSDIYAESAIAWIENDITLGIAAHLPPDLSSLGYQVIIFSRADDGCLFEEGKLIVPLLVFGSDLLNSDLGVTMHELAQNKRIFRFPETRGYADEVSFVPVEKRSGGMV